MDLKTGQMMTRYGTEENSEIFTGHISGCDAYEVMFIVKYEARGTRKEKDKEKQTETETERERKNPRKRKKKEEKGNERECIQYHTSRNPLKPALKSQSISVIDNFYRTPPLPTSSRWFMKAFVMHRLGNTSSEYQDYHMFRSLFTRKGVMGTTCLFFWRCFCLQERLLYPRSPLIERCHMLHGLFCYSREVALYSPIHEGHISLYERFSSM